MDKTTKAETRTSVACQHDMTAPSMRQKLKNVKICEWIEQIQKDVYPSLKTNMMTSSTTRNLQEQQASNETDNKTHTT